VRLVEVAYSTFTYSVSVPTGGYFAWLGLLGLTFPRTFCILTGDPASDIWSGPEQPVQQSAGSRERVPSRTAPVEPAGNGPGRDISQCCGAGDVQPAVIVRQLGKSEEPACGDGLPGTDCAGQAVEVLCESYLTEFAYHFSPVLKLHIGYVILASGRTVRFQAIWLLSRDACGHAVLWLAERAGGREDRAALAAARAPYSAADRPEPRAQGARSATTGWSELPKPPAPRCRAL
jgi:hypothetical protein